MSDKLLTFAKEFLRTKSDPEIFVDEFMGQWKKERDTGLALSDTNQISEALSSIFCAADMFNPSDDRENYEFNESMLRFEIEMVLKQMALL
jgi:hypothetical protein